MRQLTKTNEQTNLVLIQQLKLKGSSMADFISAVADKANHVNPVVRDRIHKVIAQYRKLSTYRNEIAHWQWNPCEPGVDAALIRNTLAKKPIESEKTYSLQDLRSISFGLHQVFGVVGSISTVIAANLPSEASEQIMSEVDAMFDKIKSAIADIPEPSAEELP
ncbi:hypothetical protein DZG01_15135 [Pseudomonas fluorescens]|nr:hypothetical protein DZG01_15135 [Pseudomonas fluorescens]